MPVPPAVFLKIPLIAARGHDAYVLAGDIAEAAVSIGVLQADRPVGAIYLASYERHIAAKGQNRRADALLL